MTEATVNPTIEATSAEQVADAVRNAVASGVPLVDYGVAHEGLGNAPPSVHTRLQQRGGVIEHYRDDFTVRVSAGCPFGELHRELVQAGQFLPIDADDDLTIGEIVTHNVFGPLRDFPKVRQIRVIGSNGTTLHRLPGR